MNKRTLTEEILRIKQLTQLVEQEKIDNTKTADLVTTNVEEFFQNFQQLYEKGGVSQQQRGSMNFQKDVETLQIGLILLGYDLTKFGVDGLFGPETANAVMKFKKDHEILQESADELRRTMDSIGVNEKGSEISSGGEITTEISKISGNIFKQIKAKLPDIHITVTAGNDRFHQNLGYMSKHKMGQSIDFTINPYNSENNQIITKILDSVKSALPKFKYINEYINPSRNSTGGHYHIEYGDGVVEVKNMEMTRATPEMIQQMITLLKKMNLTPEILHNYVDKTGHINQDFLEIDLGTKEGRLQYKKIADNFIRMRQPNPLKITGEMLLRGAWMVFQKHKKYLPVELALSQLAMEGGIGNNDTNSRPIRTNNPYNVGNVDDGTNKTFENVEQGIVSYFDLMGRKYLSSEGEIVGIKRYATNPNYIKNLNIIIDNIKRTELVSQA
jgi:peptidoglycan hydrolase-like protein with peptidoglycan-binding domain